MGTATQSRSSATTNQESLGSLAQGQQSSPEVDFSRSLEQQISQAIQPVLEEFRQQMAHAVEQQMQAQPMTGAAGQAAQGVQAALPRPPQAAPQPPVPQPTVQQAPAPQPTGALPPPPAPPAPPAQQVGQAGVLPQSVSQSVSQAVSQAVSPDQHGVQRPLAGVLRPALQLMEQQGEQWLQALLVAGLAALLAETTRGAIQQRAEQGLHTLLQKAFEPLPHGASSQELQAQTERTLQAILRDSLEAVFAQAMQPKTQQQGEQAIRESLHGDFGAALKSIEDTLKAILEALVAVLREQWQRVLRLLVRALLVVLENSLEKSLAS